MADTGDAHIGNWKEQMEAERNPSVQGEESCGSAGVRRLVSGQLPELGGRQRQESQARQAEVLARIKALYRSYGRDSPLPRHGGGPERVRCWYLQQVEQKEGF